MGYYSVPGFVSTTTTSYKSIATVTASATGANVQTRRGKCFEMVLGATANPASTDTAVQVDLSRVTSTGTGVATSWTPTQSDNADAAACSLSNITYTTEPATITASSSLYNIGMNQRATVRWIAAQESQYLIWPATAGAGLVLRCLSANYVSTMGGQISFME